MGPRFWLYPEAQLKSSWAVDKLSNPALPKPPTTSAVHGARMASGVSTRPSRVPGLGCTEAVYGAGLEINPKTGTEKT